MYYIYNYVCKYCIKNKCKGMEAPNPAMGMGRWLEVLLYARRVLAIVPGRLEMETGRAAAIAACTTRGRGFEAVT